MQKQCYNCIFYFLVASNERDVPAHTQGHGTIFICITNFMSREEFAKKNTENKITAVLFYVYFLHTVSYKV